MVASIGLLLLQFVPAFLVLDFTFRRMDLAPGALGGALRRWGLRFAAACAIASALGAWAQWRAGGTAGLVVAAGNWAPWWLLWRFGLRKQLTFLFQADGGRPLDTPKPDL